MSSRIHIFLLFFLKKLRTPRSTLFPYTTLFRSYGFRCCHLKNIWTAPLPPETELSRQMTTSTTSIDIMGESSVSGGRDRKSGSAGMPRPISYAVFCLKKQKEKHRYLRERMRRLR